MLKKWIVVLLVLALAVFAFAACGDTADSETNAPETSAPETDAPETEAPKCNGKDIHDVEVVEVLATCSERGYREETCKICGKLVSETAYPKTACAPSGAATCTEDSVCTVCGKVVEAAKGHAFGETVVVAATCLADGSNTRTCSVCGEAVVEAIPALAHNIPEENVTAAVAATCDTEGSKTGTCTLCNQSQTIVLPAAHHLSDLGDLAALTVVDGSLQASCASCGKVVDLPANILVSLGFDQEDIAAEVSSKATAENGLAYAVVCEADQNNNNVTYPKGKLIPDATDGHTSVLSIPHNRSATIWFDGGLLANADYYVISFDMNIGAVGGNARKVGVFGQAAAQYSEVAAESAYAYAICIDRSSGIVKAPTGEASFELNAEINRWYSVKIIVNNQTGEAFTYVDGQFFCSTQNDQFKVTADGDYSWRFGGIYNLYHKPVFDNFTVSAVQ